MTAMSRNKGNRAERDAVRWLNENGFPQAERRGGGFGGKDIIGVPITVEVKDQARSELGMWVNQLEREMDQDGNEHGVVIHKRRGKGDPGDWYATAPLYVWQRLAAAAGFTDSGRVGAVGLVGRKDSAP